MNFFEKIMTVFSNGSYILTMLDGLKITLIISMGAAAIGLLLGTLVALVKIAARNNRKLLVLDKLCDLYVYVIRGTPVALQLFIMVFAIFAIRGFPIIITATITFGINSGAYISENIRAGIQSVDIGQTEAGRSLGLGAGKTMTHIVIPQAIKNVIPSIGNEMIALIKETSIVGMVGMIDLTTAAKILGSGDKLADYLAPMVVAAIFYLIIVYALTFLIKRLERRLRKSER